MQVNKWKFNSVKTEIVLKNFTRKKYNNLLWSSVSDTYRSSTAPRRLHFISGQECLCCISIFWEMIITVIHAFIISYLDGYVFYVMQSLIGL